MGVAIKTKTSQISWKDTLLEKIKALEAEVKDLKKQLDEQKEAQQRG